MMSKRANSIAPPVHKEEKYSVFDLKNMGIGASYKNFGERNFNVLKNIEIACNRVILAPKRLDRKTNGPTSGGIPTYLNENFNHCIHEIQSD